MKRNFFNRIGGALAAAVAVAGLLFGCSDIAGTGDEGGSASKGSAAASVFIPDYDALAQQVSGARAVAPKTATVRLSSAASPAAFSAVSQALSAGEKTEGTNAAGVAGYSYKFTFRIPVGEYAAGSLKVETLGSDGSTLTSGVSASAVSVKAGGDAETASFTLVPVAADASYSGALGAGEMQFIIVTVPASSSYEVAATEGVTLFLFDASGKYSSTLTGTEIENSTEEAVTYYIGIYNAGTSAIESCSVTASAAVKSVDVTWDWVAQGVTQSSDGSTYGTDAITSGYLKGDSDTIVAQVSGGQLKITTGDNPYGTMNNGATIKVPVSSGSVVTVLAWNVNAAKNLYLGGTVLTDILDEGSTNQASYTAAKAGYITLKSAANSTYIRSIKVTGLNASDDFTSDAVSFAAGSAEVTNASSTLGLTATSVSSSDEKVATAVIADGKITITAVAAGSATITAKDSDSHEATIAVTVGDYGAVTATVTKKYSSVTLYPTAGTTYVYIFDTSHYTAQDGETDAKGTITATSYTSDYLTLTGASIASTNHGIAGAATMTLNVPAGKTTLTFVSCKYGTPGTVTVTDSSKTTLASVAMTANTDSTNDKSTTGASLSFTLTEAQTVTVSISGGYTHAIKAVTVTPVAATEVEISGETSVAAGGTITLTATLTPSNATDSVTWSSSDISIATVEGGKVTGVKEGTATITAKANDSASKEYVITVTGAAYFSSFVASDCENSEKVTTVAPAKDTDDFSTGDNSGTWTVTSALYQAGQNYTTSDYDKDNGTGYTYTARIKVKKDGVFTINTKSGTVLRVDGGTASNGNARTMAISGAEQTEWVSVATGSFYLTATSDTVTLTSSTNQFNIYGIHAVDAYVAPTATKTTTTYSNPAITFTNSSNEEVTSCDKDAVITATATVAKSSTVTAYSAGTQKTAEADVTETVSWTNATPSKSDSKVATVTTSTAGNITVTASYTVDGTAYTGSADITVINTDAADVEVTFDKNSDTASITTTPQTLKSGSGTLSKASTLGLSNTDTTVMFLGWAKTADATKADYADEGTVSVTDGSTSLTLYAVWGKIYTFFAPTIAENETGTTIVKKNEIFSTGYFSLVDTAKGCTNTKAYSTAKANDASGYTFDYGYLASGNGNNLTFKPAVNGKATIYFTVTDGNFAKKVVSKTSGSVTFKEGENDEETVIDASKNKTSSDVAYSVSFNAVKGTSYVITTASVRTALFGVAFATAEAEPSSN